MEEEEEKINEWYDQEKERLTVESEVILKTSKDRDLDVEKYNQKMKDLHAKYEQKMINLFEKEKKLILRERKKKSRKDFLSKLTKSIKNKFKKEEDNKK